MLKKLSTIGFLLIIGVFASTEYAPRVYADTTTLYESYDTGGEIDVWDDSGFRNVGNFTVEGPSVVLDDTASIGFRFKNSSAFCHATDHFSLYVSSSTELYDDQSSLWQSDSVHNTSSDFEWHSVHATGQSVVLQSGATYGIYASVNCGMSGGSDQIVIDTDPSNLIYYGYLSANGDFGPQFEINTGQTRIIQVVPHTTDPLTIVSSSTPVTISASVYVNEADYVEGMKVRQTIFIKNPKAGSLIAGGAITAVDQTLGTLVFEYPIENALSSDFSTTTTFSTIGLRTMKTELLKPQFNFFSIFGVNPNTSAVLTRFDEFLVATTTLGDVLNSNLINSIDQLGIATSTVQSVSTCNLLSGFSLTDCLVALFIPSSEDFVNLFSALQDEFLTRIPVGYVTRTVVILSGHATSTLPSLVLHLPAGSPLAGTTTIFAVDPAITTATGLLTDEYKSDSGSNLWDLITPLFTLLMYIILAMLILNEVTGIHHKKP